MKKLVLAMLVVISMMMVCIAEAAVDIATFNSKLSAFKEEKYSHGSTYQDNPSLTGGYTCFGFANEVALYIWGSYPTKSMSAASVNSGWTVTYGGSAVDNLCVGDIVRYHYHSIFITGISGDTIYYCQANTPSGTNKVTYDNTVSKSNLKSKVSDQLTSPGTTKTGWVAHYTKGIAPSTPKAPTNVKVSTSGTDVTVTWSSSANATSYDVYLIQSPWGWGDIKYSKSTTSTSYKFTGITPGSYKAFVIARPNDDTVQSSWVSFTVTSLPSAPSNPTISAIKTNGTQVMISWGAVPNATSYLCEIRKSESGFPLACTSVTTSQTSCVVDLAEGGTYYACVYAYNVSVSSGANWYIFGTPGRPKIKNVTTNGEYVTIAWDATNYATRYECKILRAEDGFSWACNPVETTETSCTVMLPEGGTYYALITAINSSGCSGADWYIFGTPGTPSVNSISSSGNQVTVSWNATEYTTYYRCTILKADDNFPIACEPVETTDTICIVTLPEGGTYYAVVYSYNLSGNSSSEWFLFGTAGKPSISSITTNGHQATISWGFTENTRNYTCKIFRSEDGFPLACTPIETTDTTCTVTLPEGGNYYAVIYAHNSIGSSGSDWCIFATKKFPCITSIVTKKGINYYINVVPVNIDDSCEIIVAAYKGGKFVALTSSAYNFETVNTTLSGDIDEIRVMAWNNLSTLKPLCSAEIIPESEWITQ